MNRKKVVKAIVLLIIALLIIFSLYNLYSCFFKGNLNITVETSSTYYSDSSIEGTVSVRKNENDKQIASNLKVELYDKDEKRIKGIKEKYKLEKGEEADLSLLIPEGIETGSYILKITAISGLNKDVAEVPINIINDVKSNIVISLDKGIYKPGDEINFRALVLSKKENIPVQNDVSIYIYDGNENKVYSNSTKTSEYGIVSGSFKLADEVNSGTYKVVVSTETQEVSKEFTVNPYITPKFEASITTDKDNYLVGETAQITVSGKYFFGEPVKGAEVKGTIDGTEVVGLTNEDGNFVTTYELTSAKSINLNFELTDTSNYMIETDKTISCGTDIFEIEVLPEFGDIVKGIDNDIYVFTKNIDGTAVKTYSTININNISKQIISDENGIGKITLTASEANSLNSNLTQSINVISEDMVGNKVNKTIDISVAKSSGILIKTDKIKYNVGDDINLTLTSNIDITSNVAYVYKNKELIKSISFDGDSVDFNLDDISGIIDIYVPNNQNSTNNYYKNYASYNNYSKKTIFIKPSKELNIGIQTSSDEYKPGDTLDIKFNTTDENGNAVDSALLVSILDEAILSLADNDLSIDNIKLALQDIVLTDGMTAADLYASILDDSSENTLKAVLLKQSYEEPGIINKTYTNNEKEEYFFKAIIGIGILLVCCIINAIKKFKKGFSNVIIPVINILAIFIILMLYLSEFLYDHLYSGSGIIIIFTNIVLTIVIYILILYKEKDFIFEMVKDFAITPILFGIISNIISLFISLIFKNTLFYEIINMVNFLLAVIVLIFFAILRSRSRISELKGKSKIVYSFCNSCVKAFCFWIVVMLLSEITDFGLLIVLVFYVLYRKLILKEAKTKMKDGKIILNISTSELVGILSATVMILIIIVFFGIYIYDNTKSDVLLSSPSKNTSNGGLYFSSTDDSSSSDITTFEATSADASADKNIMSSIFDSFSIGNFATNIDVTDSISESSINYDNYVLTNDEENEINIEKNTETEENVRNVFLESLAFIPELITENGTAELSTKISDNITTWNIQTIGNTKDGNVGYASSSFKVFKEFFVEFTLPTNSVVTDKISIPVTLYNYTENELSIDINVKENDWCIIENYDKKVDVPANSTSMIYVPIEILKEGNNVFRIETKAGDVSDVVEKTMTVGINGLEKQDVVSSGTIEKEYSQDIIFNENAIDGSQKIKVKLYATPITQIIDNIENMLKMPTGCFEQTSSSLYPDILVLEYLRKNDLSNSELEEKALNYISTGYQKLLTYEVNGTKGGYSLYGNSPAEPVITAFGLMEMNELSNVYDVDENVIENMKEYLFDVQKTNGTFEYKSTYIGSASSTDDMAMNAYIIWALSEVCPDDTRLDKSVEYLKNKLDDITDNYTLSLIANILANVNDKDSKDVVNEILDKIQTTDEGAYIASSISDYYGTKGKYQNIQATALTSMALTKLEINQNTNSSLIDYLISSKDYRGTWGTTQSTILALKAINYYSENSDLKNQTISVNLNGEEKYVDIEEDYLDVYEFEFENVSKENNVTIGIKKGKITYEIVKEYYEEYSNIVNDFDIDVTQTIDTDVKVNDVINQTITVKNNYETIYNGLLQINIPQGCSVIEDSLLELQYDGKIEKYEYNYGTINIYIRDFDKGDETTLNVQYRALYPETITGAAIRFWDYYNPEVEGICSPVGITVSR